MTVFLHHLLSAIGLAAGMFWQTAWSLMLGLTIAGVIRSVVPTEQISRTLGRAGLREVAMATIAGALSSSCSYASAAVSRTLFKKGAALIPSLAFLLASTNLVIELGLILALLMGWQFTLAEWLGGVLMIAIMAVLVGLTYPKHLVEAARAYPETGHGGHDHGDRVIEGPSFWARLTHPDARVAIAQNVMMDVSMLWKDVAIGFLIAGTLAAFVPDEVWRTLFVNGASQWLREPANALMGPLIAVLSFVCSIGNVPLAAVLWGSGIGFSGVLAFLYADLIVLPLLDLYRRYYGLKMAAYIAAIFYISMVVTALVIGAAFTLAGAVPPVQPAMRADMMQFSFNYTFWLNLLFGLLGLYLFRLTRRQPSHCHN
jgi:uncharacterized membrane protein YraQ (UPF0718 family)